MLKRIIVLFLISSLLVSCGNDDAKKESKSEGQNNRLEQVKMQIKFYRDSMKTAGVDHLSFYSLEYISHDTLVADTAVADSAKMILSIGEFNANADKYVDKEVEIKGIVDHVCKHGGKKILLVSDDGDIHVFSKERFNEDLVGSELIVKGKVIEKRIDEAYLLKWEEDAINEHKEGKEGEK